MFANEIKILKDSNFSSYITEVAINSCDIQYDKIILKGKIGIDKKDLLTDKIIIRIAFLSDAPKNTDVLEPSYFSYKDLEANIDGVRVHQRIILNPEFSVEIPNLLTNLQNVTMFFSFIGSGEDSNLINYYQNIISYVASTKLIDSFVLSDKTYVSTLFDDRKIINPTTYPSQDEELYVSELFHSIDQQNNFYASVFYNIEEVLKNKIWFKNLINFPKFYDYFVKNYLIDVKAYLINGSFKQPLTCVPEKNITVPSGRKNTYLLMRAENIDNAKYDGGLINIEVNYNESSVRYIQEIIIPFISNLERNIKSGLVTNEIFDLLIQYKLTKEFVSEPSSLTELLVLQQANPDMQINENNVNSLLEIINFTKNKLINLIYDVGAINIANTSFKINLEQPVYLQRKNAKLNFFNLRNVSINFPTYKMNELSSSFIRESSRYFPRGNITIENSTISLNSLPITYSPLNVNFETGEVLSNSINFNNYSSISINDEEKESFADQFGKIVGFFSLNREKYKLDQYSFKNLLDKNLFYNNIEVHEVTSEKQREPRFSIVKRDNPRSFITFPDGFSNDACLDSTYTVPSVNIQEDRLQTEIPENLENNLSVNKLFQDSNLYSNSYKTLTELDSLPVQVLFPKSQFDNRTNQLFTPIEPVINDAKLFGIFYMNFKIIARIEYLQDITDGCYAIWDTLTINSMGALRPGQKLFCRLNFYRNSDCKITEQSFDAFSIYNKYFYLEA